MAIKKKRVRLTYWQQKRISNQLYELSEVKTTVTDWHIKKMRRLNLKWKKSFGAVLYPVLEHRVAFESQQNIIEVIILDYNFLQYHAKCQQWMTSVAFISADSFCFFAASSKTIIWLITVKKKANEVSDSELRDLTEQPVFFFRTCSGLVLSGFRMCQGKLQFAIMHLAYASIDSDLHYI